jgi:hypothetical protein
VYLLEHSSETEPYLLSGQPARQDTTTCLMGAFDKQQPVQLKRFETCSLGKVSCLLSRQTLTKLVGFREILAV